MFDVYTRTDITLVSINSCVAESSFTATFLRFFRSQQTCIYAVRVGAQTNGLPTLDKQQNEATRKLLS